MPYTGPYTIATRCLTEFLGTMFTIGMAEAMIANELLTGTKGHHFGFGFVAFGFGMAFTFGITMFGHSSAALNPAMALCNFVRGEIIFTDFLALSGSQILGAFVGAMFPFIMYYPHFAIVPTGDSNTFEESHQIKGTSDIENVFSSECKPASDAAIAADQATKLSIFCCTPQINLLWHNCTVEFLGTFVLTFTVAMIEERWAMMTPELHDSFVGTMQPFLVGMFVMLLVLAVGGPTGIAANPARDFGPRFAHFLLPIPGKGPSDLKYGLTVAVACLAGGALAGGVFLAAEYIPRY
ncbi:hypothetical protein HDU98_009815 [Podochytrium sp. JEL0797]|nr:hypothetical protein HDU98_009815 [Podochytrium sp. JEL0797]